jgi:hypothetical protein
VRCVATTPCDGSTETAINWQTRAFRIHKSVAAPATVLVFNHYGFQLQLECLSDPITTGEYDAFLEARVATARTAKLTGIVENMDSFTHIDMDLTTSSNDGGLFRATGTIGDTTDAVVDATFIFTESGQVVSIPVRVIANGGNDACTVDGTATPS